MSDLEQFSPEQHLARWQLAQESVIVEGTLQQDGDYYVIDRDPAHPGTLLRVQTTHVPHYEKTRTIPCIGGERQLYRILIKKGVPVECVAIVLASNLALGIQHHRTHNVIQVRFQNYNSPDHWTVVDVATNGVVLDRDFKPNEIYPPEGQTGITVQASDAGFGEVKYTRPGRADPNDLTRTNWDDKDLIRDSDTVQLYCTFRNFFTKHLKESNTR
jgi:hypothetical protein